MKPTIIIADDHTIVREGLQMLLEKKGFNVANTAKTGSEAVDLCIRFQPDVVIMDISMPDLNGVEATAAIKKALPDIKVITLSMHSSKKMIDQMFESGASAYLLKESAINELEDAICTVSTGNYYLSASIARMYTCGCSKNVSDIRPGRPRSKEISKKERQVLQLVAEGGKSKEIAEKLCVSIKTVESHRRNLMKKLCISNTAGLIRFAIKEGITFLK